MSTKHVVHHVIEPGLAGDGFTAPEAAGVRADIYDLTADNILARGRTFDVKAYGAKGDGVTDDSAAIQAAINDISGGHGGRGGGTVVIPYGAYVVNETIVVDKPGVVLKAAGQFTGHLYAGPALTGPVIRFKDTTYVMRGPSIENLVIAMGPLDSPAGGIEIMGAYDNATLRNVFITGLKGNARGISIVPNPDAVIGISQTLLAENCWVSASKTSGFTGQCWNIENLQEAVFIGCKGVGPDESLSGGMGTAFRVSGSKGIAFHGCSAALVTNGWHIRNSSNRTTNTITIDTPTIEGVLTPFNVTGSSSLGVRNISVRTPRVLESTGTIPTGAGESWLSYVTEARLETRSLAVTINSTCNYIQVRTFDASKITDNGNRSLVIETPNALNSGRTSISTQMVISDRLRTTVPGRDGYWEDGWNASPTTDLGHYLRYNSGSGSSINAHTITGGVTQQSFFLAASGVGRETLRLANPSASLETGMLLLWSDAGTMKLSRVTVGATDSGGAGFRVLRVPN